MENCRRVEAGHWHLAITEGEGDVSFPALGVSVPLSEAFAGIDRVVPAEEATG